jgi:hypothetical protein
MMSCLRRAAEFSPRFGCPPYYLEIHSIDATYQETQATEDTDANYSATHS